MNKLRIAFAGTPEFACPTLAALLSSRHTVVGVLTQPDRPAGRGLELRASPVKTLALKHGLAIDQPVALKLPEQQAPLAAWRADVLVVIAYGLILPPSVLAIPPLGCINVHGSLLPRWRGAAPIQRAILAGDSQTGVSIMRMEAGLDTGPVYLERRIPLPARATAGVVHDQLATLGAAALLETIEAIAAGTARAQPQASAGVSYAHKIDKQEAAIDWRQSAIAIDRLVRAFNPWPIAYTTLGGETVKIHEAEPIATGETFGVPGEWSAGREDTLHVACGSGTLVVKRLQRAGKRPISAREFANAYTGERPRFGA